MAISTAYQEAIDLVDNTKILTFHTEEPGYDAMEWSYSGLDVYGGSDQACEAGAAELLHEMGFRFYAPNPDWGWKLPASINTGLSAVKQKNWFESTNIWLAYGHSWSAEWAASRTTLNANMSKWQKLTGVGIPIYPAGHRWDNIIGQNSAWFASNPQVLMDSNSFDLATLQDAVDQTDYNNLVMICAAEILKQGLSSFNRASFDPSDGDTNNSDRVFSFSKDVVDQVRAGTSAIGTHPARDGNPDAQLGVYAYAGHRLPPTNSASPGIYTQVALAFNSTGLSYLELVEGHAEKCDAIMLRDYLDTQVWSQSAPLAAKVRLANLGTSYDGYKAAGCVGSNSEFAANWFNNIAGTYNIIRKWKTGTSDYDAMMEEMVDDLFDGDPAVKDLYTLFGNSRETYHLWNLKRIFDIVSRMQDSWYKTYFKYWAVILYELRYLPDQTPIAQQDASDPFPAAFSKMMAHVIAVRDLDIMHSYAFMRQQANAVVATNYPDLRYSATPKPDYWTSPYLPTDYDFNKAHATLSADTDRDADLDSEDLVLVRGITARYGNGSAAGTNFYCEGLARYLYIGPGSITFTEETPDPDTTFTEDYPEGVNVIYMTGNWKATPTGGYLFLDGFPSVRKDPSLDSNAWLYVPTRCKDNVKITSSVRIVINDGTGELDIFPSTDPATVAALRTGQLYVQPTETRGAFQILNANRYLSLNPNIALMPRVIAEEDFTPVGKVRGVASLPDTASPTTPGTPTVSSTTDVAIGLVWSASTDASEITYLVYRDDVFVGSSKEPAYIDTGLTPETQYTYKVVAKDVVGNLSSASGTVQGTTTAADTTAPSTPTGLAVVGYTDTTVTIDWEPSTDNIAVAGYNIYIDTVLEAVRANTRYVATGLTGGTSYDFQVSAFDDAGNESALTSAVTQVTLSADVEAPTTPANLAVTLETIETIALDWDASTDNIGVAGYRVYQYDPIADTYEVALTTTTATAGTVGGLAPGTTYSFKVSAYDAAGNESALSSAVEGTTT